MTSVKVVDAKSSGPTWTGASVHRIPVNKCLCVNRFDLALIIDQFLFIAEGHS